MGRKGVRFSSEEKLYIVEQISNGCMSISECARQFSINNTSIDHWLRLYRKHGPLVFIDDVKNKVYSDELKKQAIISYLQGNESLMDVAVNFGLKSTKQLRSWIKMYNNGEESSRRMSGGSRMTTSRQTTKEERIKITKECIANGCNYSKIAIKYQVSYQQVYGWVQRYKDLGEAGLEDRRGRRKLNQEPRNELEKLQIENERLKHKLYMAEMERDLLKKLDELERKDLFRK